MNRTASFLAPLALLCLAPLLIAHADEPAFRHAILYFDADAAPVVLDVAKKPGTGSGGVPTNYGCGVLPAGKAITTTAGLSTILKASTSVCYLCDMKTPNTCTITSPESLKGAKFLK